ncbi:MAG: PQQ-binding-like beta-propeller repeat protein, partial [Armatimonadetes bacterium]|nr:PQQ-binding-like beta-propeller repeat protein [Armatimonadota bacterium]
GATLWEPFPLDKPVYPERGAPAIAGGKLFAASIEGVCVCLDALRGTRLWETRLPTPVQVYGAVLPVTIGGGTSGDATIVPDLLLVPATLGEDKSHGAVYVLSAETGQVLREVPLGWRTDTAPTFGEGLAFAHDDAGYLTAFDPATGSIAWQMKADAGFDAAPVYADGGVFSACASGTLYRRNAGTGAIDWQLPVTNAPLSGTPACDGVSVYVPADDGLHVVSASTGRSVRRFGGKRPVRSSPVVTAGGTVFWGATDGAIYGVRGNSPAEPLYDPRTPGAQFTAPIAVADGAIFAAASNGVLFALSHVAPEK